MLDLINRSHQDPKGKNSRKPLKYILIDSVIIGAVAMSACMPNVIPTVTDLWVMGKAFFIAFVFEVTYERGLKKKEG